LKPFPQFDGLLRSECPERLIISECSQHNT
jgi:hypothetical protein